MKFMVDLLISKGLWMIRIVRIVTRPLDDDQIDAERCPVCGCLLDWKIYHIINEGG